MSTVATVQNLETTAKSIAYIGGTFVVVAGGIWGIRKLNRLKKEQDLKDGAFDDVLNPNTPESFANRLRRAFDWGPFGWGTDNDEVFAVFNEMPSKGFYNEVAVAYSRLTKGGNLNTDLDSEMSDSELKKLAEILKAKPDR